MESSESTKAYLPSALCSVPLSIHVSAHVMVIRPSWVLCETTWVHAIKPKSHLWISSRLSFSTLGYLLLRCPRNKSLNLPRGPAVSQGGHGRYSLNCSKGPFVWLTGKLRHYIFSQSPQEQVCSHMFGFIFWLCFPDSTLYLIFA